MSGSSTDSGGPSGGSRSPSFNCQNVSIRATIISPDPVVLSTISVRDVLIIEIQAATGPVVALTTGRQLVGSVFTTNLADLIACLNDGVEFEAKVLSKSGGDCQILITNK